MFPLANFGWRRGASGGAIISLLNTALQWLYKFTSPATAPDKTTPAYDALYVESPCLTFGKVTGEQLTPPCTITKDVFTLTAEVLFNDPSVVFHLYDGRQGVDDGVRIYSSGGSLFAQLNTDTTAGISLLGLNDGAYHTVSLSSDGSTMTLTIDAVSEAVTITSVLDVPAQTSIIGNNSNGLQPFDGRMTRFSLSEDGVCGFDYPMVETSGTTVYDVSGKGNHGTITTTDGTTLLAMWAQTQDVSHYLANYGFYVAVAETPPYIPALLDGTGAADGVNPISNPAGLLHNWGPHSIKNDDYNVVDILASGGVDALLPYIGPSDGKPSWQDNGNAIYWNVDRWAIGDATEDWEWPTSYTGTFPPVGIPSGVGTLGSDPVTLTYNELLVQGGEWATIGTAEIAAHPNFLYNSVFKYTDDCFVSDMLTWSIAYEWAASDFYRVDNWVGDVCYEPSLIPYPVTAGTGIGPSEDWYTYDGTNIYLVEDA
jgi:hypothetical protein